MRKEFSEYLTEIELIQLKDAILLWWKQNKLTEFQDKKMQLILVLALEEVISQNTLAL